MKAAFQNDDALLADIARARAEGRTRLWWLGQSGFLLHTRAGTVLFDPYLSDSLTKKYATTDKPHTRVTERVIAAERLTGIDVITSSHNHTDHLDAETLLPLLAAKSPGPVDHSTRQSSVCAGAARRIESVLVAADAGERVSIAGMEFHGIPAAHNTVERDEHGGCRFLGYVARVGGKTIYHSGDTVMHDELIPALKPFRVDVALVPINGNKPERRVAGNLNGREAAGLAHAIGACVAVPHHFDLFAFNTESPAEFEAAGRRLGQPFRTLQNGEGVDL